MSDDRRFERSAREWLEAGPTQAPDRVVQAALIEIDSTPQERDLRIPWRYSTMPLATRFAAALLVVAVAGGGALLLFRSAPGGVGAPNPSQAAPASSAPSDDANAAMKAYRTARNAICRAGNEQKAPLIPPILKALDPAATQTDIARGVVALESIAALSDDIADQLQALEPPPEIVWDHVATITQGRDMTTLIRYEVELFRSGDSASARAVDKSLDQLGGQISAFEAQHNLLACP